MDEQVGQLPPWAEKACNAIDAGFFSAETFHDPAAIKRVEWFIARWKRELKAIKSEQKAS